MSAQVTVSGPQTVLNGWVERQWSRLWAEYAHQLLKAKLYGFMFASLRAQGWTAIVEQLVLSFDPDTAEMMSGKLWDILELREIGWATYRSHRVLNALPTEGFPGVIPVKDQGVIYLTSRELSGRTTKSMEANAWKLKAALEPPPKPRSKRR